MRCPTCHGRAGLVLEPHLMIPCPVCRTTEAVAAVGRAQIIVRECSTVDRGQAGAALDQEELTWVRCQTRPYPAYITRWQGGGQPLWSVVWDGENRCWRANRGAGTLADAQGRPRDFDGMDAAMLWCERAAKEEQRPPEGL